MFINKVRTHATNVARSVRSTYTRHMRLCIAAFTILSAKAAAFAQTPVPPVEIDIPTNDMIGYLNDWIEIFGPIVLFVGMIPVALGLLRYVTRLFQSAFGS